MYIITRRKYVEVPIINNATILIREETCQHIFGSGTNFIFGKGLLYDEGGEYVLQQEIVIEIIISDT